MSEFARALMVVFVSFCIFVAYTNIVTARGENLMYWAVKGIAFLVAAILGVSLAVWVEIIHFINR